MPPTITENGFSRLGLPTQLLAIVDRLGFTVPTPIQEQAIPLGLDGRDIIGIAQTGTGKTLAFGLPMIAYLKQQRGLGLVVVPTRELALQVEETLRKVGGPLLIKTACLIGGASMHRQVQQIRGGAHVVIATPGRLMDHLKQGTVRLDNVRVAVLDEADRMLDMGFLPDITQIMSRIPTQRQTLLFSATMPAEIEKLAQQFLNNPVRVEVAPRGTAAELVEQSLMVVPLDEKSEVLRKLIDESEGTVLVFARTRHGARKTAKMVRDFGHSAAEIHSDRTLAQRREALDGFKGGAFRVLVATDIAARGIDVKRIEMVVNYDVPDNPDDYIHRIGRTGRAGETGRAVSIATPQQAGMVRDIERLLGHEIPIAEDSPLRFAPRQVRQGSGPRPSRGPRPPRMNTPRPPRREPEFEASRNADRDPRRFDARPTPADRPAQPETGKPMAPRPETRAPGRPSDRRPYQQKPEGTARPGDRPPFKPAGEQRPARPANGSQPPRRDWPRSEDRPRGEMPRPAPIEKPKPAGAKNKHRPGSPAGAKKKPGAPEGPHPFQKFMGRGKRK